MANGSAARRYQALLQEDLSSGSPVHYRKIPGTRQYYRVSDRTEVSEHYVLRVYRPRLNEMQRYVLKQESSQYVRKQGLQRRSILNTYIAKEKSEGRTVTSRSASASAEFKTNYTRLRMLSYESRDLTKRQDLSPTGEYAALLVALGRRLPTDKFDVGQSPEGWIDSHVLPALGG